MFLRDYADTSAQICGQSEKVHGAEADRSQLVLKKGTHKHIRASSSPAMKISPKRSMKPSRRTWERVTKTRN